MATTHQNLPAPPSSADYYRVLNLNRSANADDIKSSYRKLALKYHPHVASENRESLTKFFNISEAFDVLGDSKKKSVYDRFGVDGLKNGIPNEIKVPENEIQYQGQYNFSSQKAMENFENFFGTKNPFDSIFSITNQLLVGPDSTKNTDGKFGNVPTSLPTEKAPTIIQDIPLTLEELHRGAFKKIQVQRQVVDKATNSLSTETKQFTLEIKKGWKDGTKIVFAGQGNQSHTQNSGDVQFIVRAKPHPVFQRQDNNLVLTKKITLLSALSGAYLDIDTLDGRKLTIQIHDVITPAYKKIVPGEGMPVAGKSNDRGDLIINFDVEYPVYLNDYQKQLLREALLSNAQQ